MNVGLYSKYNIILEAIKLQSQNHFREFRYKLELIQQTTHDEFIPVFLLFLTLLFFPPLTDNSSSSVYRIEKWNSKFEIAYCIKKSVKESCNPAKTEKGDAEHWLSDSPASEHAWKAQLSSLSSGFCPYM